MKGLKYALWITALATSFSFAESEAKPIRNTSIENEEQILGKKAGEFAEILGEDSTEEKESHIYIRTYRNAPQGTIEETSQEISREDSTRGCEFNIAQYARKRIKTLEQIAETDSNNYDIFLELGELCKKYQDRDANNAIKYFKRCIEINPNESLPYIGIGKIYLSGKMYNPQESIKYLIIGCERSDDAYKKCKNYLQIIDSYTILKEYDAAKKYINMAEKTLDEDWKVQPSSLEGTQSAFEPEFIDSLKEWRLYKEPPESAEERIERLKEYYRNNIKHRLEGIAKKEFNED